MVIYARWEFASCAAPEIRSRGGGHRHMADLGRMMVCCQSWKRSRLAHGRQHAVDPQECGSFGSVAAMVQQLHDNGPDDERGGGGLPRVFAR